MDSKEDQGPAAMTRPRYETLITILGLIGAAVVAICR
jgi:hypothetical protein